MQGALSRALGRVPGPEEQPVGGRRLAGRASGPRSTIRPRVHSRRWCGQWVRGRGRLAASLPGSTLASNHKPAEAFQDSHFSHHDSDKFPPFNCLRKKLSRVLTCGRAHPHVPGPSPTAAARPTCQPLPTRRLAGRGSRPRTQPAWAPRTGHRPCPREALPFRCSCPPRGLLHPQDLGGQDGTVVRAQASLGTGWVQS